MKQGSWGPSCKAKGQGAPLGDPWDRPGMFRKFGGGRQEGVSLLPVWIEGWGLGEVSRARGQGRASAGGQRWRRVYPGCQALRQAGWGPAGDRPRALKP